MCSSDLHLSNIGGPAKLVDSTVKWSFGINNKAILPATIQRACQLAMAAPKGPTFVSLPMEYMLAKMIKDVPGDHGFAPGATADPKGIEELANLLAGAKNPVIVAEDAGRTEKSVHCLVEISELLACAVCETRSTGALNFPRAHPLHSGYDAKKACSGTDVILLLAVIAPWHPASITPTPGATVALLDENPFRHDIPYYGYQADLSLTGEIESSLESLLAALKKKVSASDASRKQRAEELGRKNNAQRKAWRDEASTLANQKPMDTRWVAHEISQVLPSDAMIVDETITHRLALHRYLDGVKAGSWFAGCIGGLGTGLSTALGVKAANPKRPVVCVIGDGSFNYDPVPGVYGAAQEHNLPFLTIMFNNQGYLSQKSGIPRYYPDGWAVQSKNFSGLHIAPCPEYSQIMKAFDGYGEKVEEPGEVRKAIERGLRAVAGGQAALLDIRLKPVEQIVERGEG